MSQNKTITISKRSDDGTETGTLVLQPSRARDGIFEYKVPSNGYPFSNGSVVKLTASSRPGAKSIPSAGVKAVKRRTVLKLTTHQTVPSDVGIGDIPVPCIMDLVFTHPVECSEEIMRTMFQTLYDAIFVSVDSPLEDLVVNGNEPY